jgi:hypothetical protein
MTMQVGLIGSDGIVLASDTKWMHQPREEQTFWGGRYGTNSTKIKLTPQVAVSCAEDMETAGFLADEIIRYTQSGDNRPQKTVFKEIAARIPRQHEHPAKCLAVVPGDSLRLYSFLYRYSDFDHEWTLTCKRELSKAVAGDSANSALFFAERYHQISLTVAELVPLAAHVVVSAHPLNTAGVSDLEIVTCDSSGVKRIPINSIEVMERKAQALDIRIGQIVLGKDGQA